MDAWSYNAELGREVSTEQARVPVFQRGTYLGQIEEVGMGHTRRGDPKLAITLRIWTGHPSDPSSVSRTVNEHLVKDGGPDAVRLSAMRSVQLAESLGMEATGSLPLEGLQGRWVGVAVSDKVESFAGKDGKPLTIPVNRVRGYTAPDRVTGPVDPSRPVIHPPMQQQQAAPPPVQQQAAPPQAPYHQAPPQAPYQPPPPPPPIVGYAPPAGLPTQALPPTGTAPAGLPPAPPPDVSY